MDDEAFLEGFFRSLVDHALDPDDRLYVELYADSELSSLDPVARLAKAIRFSQDASTLLFSGFRGTGKSTELRRLRRTLQGEGHLVVLCDLADYLNLTSPVDVSDFLVTLAGAFSDVVALEPELLGRDPAAESYWERFVGFLTRTRIEVEGFQATVPGAGVKLKGSLKQDPSFRGRLQQVMKGHLAAVVKDVRSYVGELVAELRAEHPERRDIVLILDSIEQIRGTSANADEVHRSVEELFAGHADKLRFEGLHVVYTVPPWLKIRSPGVEGYFAQGELIPCVKVIDSGGRLFEPGLAALETLVARRGDWVRLLGERELLRRLCLGSGGYLRDLLRLLRECVLGADPGELPVPPAVVDLAVSKVRDSYLPIANEDAVWLARVAETHDVQLGVQQELPRLAGFFDSHLVLRYRNGEEWYDVHPLVAEHVARQAAQAAQAAGPGG